MPLGVDLLMWEPAALEDGEVTRVHEAGHVQDPQPRPDARLGWATGRARMREADETCADEVAVPVGVLADSAVGWCLRRARRNRWRE